MEDTNPEEVEEKKVKASDGKHTEAKGNSSRMLAVAIVSVLVVVGVIVVVNTLISSLVFG